MDGHRSVESCWRSHRKAVEAEGGHSSAEEVDVDNRSGAVAVAGSERE